MNNIFENAYYGKPYKTRDGRKALYHNILSTTEGMKHYLETISSGFICDNCGKSLCEDDSIVSVWEEEINEEELEELAKSYDIPIFGDGCTYSDEEWDEIQNWVKEAYKAGYRKGLK